MEQSQINIINLILGLVGTVTGVISLLLKVSEWLRDRPRIVLDVSLDSIFAFVIRRPIHKGDGWNLEVLPEISVRNNGQRRATIFKASVFTMRI